MGNRISAFADSRDNNFNLIRMIAATSVLVSHAWPITLGTGTPEPLEEYVGGSLGWIAVAIFFAISGFLIARSFDRSERVADWFSARAVRLFPGLAVVLLLTVLILGPVVTQLPLAQYATQPGTLTYFPRNFTLAFLQYDLPGVFVGLPYPDAINGSLWTLIYEVVCYGGVLVLGFLGLIKRPAVMIAAAVLFFAVYAAIGVLHDQNPLPQRIVTLRNLAFPFFVGTLLYVWRHRIPLSWPIAALVVAACVLAHGTVIFPYLFIVAVSYLVFVLAYLPGGAIRAYNRIGDYSYGMYIYAFPAQQLVAFLVAPDSPWVNIALSLPASLLCAYLSWHFVENPALTWRKNRLARRRGR